MGLAQPLRGFDPLWGAGILDEYGVQAFPRFVLGQLRQRFESGGRGAGAFDLIQQPLQARIPAFGIAGWIAVLIDRAEPELPLFGDGDQHSAALLRLGLRLGVKQRQRAGGAADGDGARLAALIQRPDFQFAIFAQREQAARQRAVLLVAQRGAEQQTAHRSLMGGVTAAVFFVNRAFQKANPDRAIAATGHDAAIAGESEAENTAFAAGHGAGFGISELRRWQDVNGVIGSGGGHAGTGGIHRDGVQGLFAQAALGGFVQAELFAFGHNLMQLENAVLADADHLGSKRRQSAHRAAVGGLLGVRGFTFAVGAPQRQCAIRRARQQQAILAERQRGRGGVQRCAETSGELGQLQQVNARLGDARRVATTSHGQELAAGGNGQ